MPQHVASGRVPYGLARGDLVASWWNPTSVLAGVLAVGTTAYLAAVYLTADARRGGHIQLADAFRRRGLAAAMVTGAIAIGGLVVLRFDAPRLYAGLTGRALPLIAVSAAAGLASIALLAARGYSLARVTAALAVAAVLWGWGMAQYPVMLPPHVTVSDAAATSAVLHATVATVVIGMVVLIPSLLWLLTLFQRARRPVRPGSAPGSGPASGPGRTL
jgi:cytochrome bd ubiquinol oxidase subunit II